MYEIHSIKTFYFCITSFFLLSNGCKQEEKATLEIKYLNPEEAAEAAKQIREEVTVSVADGLELTLWATDSLAPDPVALDVDDQGRVYMTRTNRQKHSEFDIRGHVDWMTDLHFTENG